ncbi:hypothetical protein E4T50_17028 [Aureobasidium sp. EXF-12298]|nr:hypothetical protein E4T50_17028 [Aureobasidium sp. EXF-12298]
MSCVKKAFVHLFLDASHVQSLGLCDVDEAIPPSVMSALVKRALRTSSDGITALRFALKSQAPLIVPDLVLHRKSSCADLEALLRIGQCEIFKVYVLSSAISRERLSSLCSALAEGTLQPAPEGVISNLYVNSSYKRVTHVDQIWSSNPSPPPYDPSTAPGASNDHPAGPSDPIRSSSSRAHAKRRSISPALLQTPSKRQLLTEKAAPEPWELAITAQGAVIAALQAELSSLRREVQHLQRAPGIDAETQTDPIVEHEPASTEADSSYISHSPASTVEMTTDDRLNIMEGNIDERFKRSEILLGRLDAKLNDSNKEIKHELELETFSLNFLIEDLNSRVCDLENDLQDDLRKEFEEAIETKGSDLQVKLEDFIENKLEDVEEIVKQDVRIALGNAKYDFSIDF